MSAGKGDRPRNCFSRAFRQNYDEICWSAVKKPTTLTREEQIARYLNTGKCPKCGSECEGESKHERDSTWDNVYCVNCDWEASEMEIWNNT